MRSEIGVAHGELAEADGAAVESEEVVPLGEFDSSVSELP